MLLDAGLLAGRAGGGIDRVAQVAAAFANAVDRESRFPAEAVAAMREEGLLGALIPTSLGGHGLTLTEAARQIQTLARACASSAMILAMHHIQVACVLDHALDDAWHRALAERIAGEQLLVASITSEVGIGGDMRSSLCAVERIEDRFVLAKQAPTISYGAQADLLFVTARAGADAPASDQVLVAVEARDSRLEPTGSWDSLGMRGTCSGGFAFTGEGLACQVLPVPFAEIAAETMVPVSHLLWAAAWTGIAVEATSRARAFLRAATRRQPGAAQPGAARLIDAAGLLQMMQARLSLLLGQYDASHRLGDPRRPMQSPEQSGWPTGMAQATAMNMLKRDVSEHCHAVVLQALMICGMQGYRNDTDFSVGRHLRDILSAPLMISNDRIAMNTGTLLIAQRAELGAL